MVSLRAYADNKSVTKMQKPDKIYMHNPNMLCALSSNLNVSGRRSDKQDYSFTSLTS